MDELIRFSPYDPMIDHFLVLGGSPKHSIHPSVAAPLPPSDTFCGPTSPMVHPALSSGLTNEGFPRLRVLALPPGVRPAHHHRVGRHSSQAAGLNHVADALTRLLGHDTLAEALHSLLLHQVLQGLKVVEDKENNNNKKNNNN